MAYINKTKLYLDLIQEILNKNTDIYSIEFIQNGLSGLVEKNPILNKLMIDDNFQLHSELPDFDGSIDGLKDFLMFLYNYIDKLLSPLDVEKRFTRIGEDFLKLNSTEILRSDLLASLPSLFFKDKNKIEKLDLTVLRKESHEKQLLIIYESVFTVYLQEVFKTDDKNLFFTSVNDLKQSFPILNQFLITKTGDVTILPKDDMDAKQLVKDLADVFNYFVDFSTYHLGSDLAIKRAQEIISPIMDLLDDLPAKLGMLDHLLKGALKKRISTGIPGFDNMVQGGIPKGKSILIQSTQGTEKNFFVSHFIKNSLNQDSNIMIVLGQVSPKIFNVQLKTLDVDISKYEDNDRLKIIDWYTWRKIETLEVGQGKAENNTFVSGDFSKLWQAIENTLNSLKFSPTKCAVLNILSPALKTFKLEQVKNFVKGIIQKFKDNDVTAIFMIEKDSHTKPELAAIRTLFDGVIDIENENIDGKMSSKIRILFMYGTDFDPKFKLITLDGTKINISQT